MPISRRIVLGDQARTFVERLHPDHRRQIKAALKELEHSQGDIRALENELSELYRLRVGSFRVVFRYEPDNRIVCIFIERRRSIYDLLRQNPTHWN